MYVMFSLMMSMLYDKIPYLILTALQPCPELVNRNVAYAQNVHFVDGLQEPAKLASDKLIISGHNGYLDG